MSSSHTMHQFGAGLVRRTKKLLVETSTLLILFIVISSCSIILSIFFLDFKLVTIPAKLISFTTATNTTTTSSESDGIGDDTTTCDLSDGDWVWDNTSYPLYQSKDCPFMDGGFRCSENGRPDNSYQNWRWKPKACSLPTFNASQMLQKFRNGRIVFVGDSIGRNQWESMLCMLATAVLNKTSIYEVNGNPIDKHKGFLIFMFSDYNVTVEYYRSTFLVGQGRPPAGLLPPDSNVVRTTLQLDRLDWTSHKWRGADLLVFNTGHWWNHGKTIRTGCYFQVGNKVKMNMSIDDAYKRSLETLNRWIDTELDPNVTQVFYRTYAPSHFSGGDWKSGGACHLETQPEFYPARNSLQTNPHYRIAIGAFKNNSTSSNMNLLNITYMTMLRKDAHLSLYYNGPGREPAPVKKQDCSHWCLPGVPDTWNELLYALSLRTTLQNFTIFA